MLNEKTGRPVRIVSISFNNKSLDEISGVVDQEGSKGTDIIVLPETWNGEQGEPETLEGVTVSRMAELAEKNKTYIVCPIFRKTEYAKRLNSAILLDRQGKVVFIYDKVFPYWSEFDLQPPTGPGLEAPVYQADFGCIGIAICFDVNFPEVWKRMADQGAELILWVSAYSAGTTLQAHAINHNYYIVTSTSAGDCIVYDITGEEIFYEKSEGINVSRITLDLDRRIYHQDFNIEKRDKLLAEHGDSIQEEIFMEREQWFVLKAVKPGVSVRETAKKYGMEELRDYKERSRREIDKMRGWRFIGKTI